MATDAPILEMSKLILAGRLKDVLSHGLDWTVSASQAWIVAGMSSDGRHDFIQTAAGLLKPASGSLRLFGLDVFDLDERAEAEVRRKIGVVFENGSRLFHQISVYDNVALALRYHFDFSEVEAAPRVEEVLRHVGLEAQATAYPSALSMAWRQRVLLARALALSPAFLLLNNPLEGLDSRHRRWWVDFLQSLNRGHELLGGRPATMVIAVDEIGELTEVASHFGVVRAAEWRVLTLEEMCKQHTLEIADETGEPR